MSNYTSQLSKFCQTHQIKMELITYDKEVTNTLQSIQESGLSLDQIVKTVLVTDKQDKLYAVIIGGKYKVDTKVLRQHFQTSKLSLLPRDKVLDQIGYPAGGVPPFGYEAIFCMDQELVGKGIVYCGGGDTYTLMKIDQTEIQKNTRAVILELHIA